MKQKTQTNTKLVISKYITTMITMESQTSKKLLKTGTDGGRKIKIINRPKEDVYF